MRTEKMIAVINAIPYTRSPEMIAYAYHLERVVAERGNDTDENPMFDDRPWNALSKAERDFCHILCDMPPGAE